MPRSKLEIENRTAVEPTARQYGPSWYDVFIAIGELYAVAPKGISIAVERQSTNASTFGIRFVVLAPGGVTVLGAGSYGKASANNCTTASAAAYQAVTRAHNTLLALHDRSGTAVQEELPF